MRVASLTSLLLLTTLACWHDAADREHLAALRGDEDGSTRAEQLAHLDRAIALRPDRARYWETRAIHRIDERDFAAARSDLDRAIVLADRPYLRFLRGLVTCQQGEHARSLADFDEAIAAQPANAQFYRGRGLARVAVGRPSEGLEDAERLVLLDPQVGTSYHVRGVALAALGRPAEALADFEECIRRRPELVYPRTAAVSCLVQLGESARAAELEQEAARVGRERARCAPCLDPFRY